MFFVGLAVGFCLGAIVVLGLAAVGFADMKPEQGGDQ